MKRILYSLSLVLCLPVVTSSFANTANVVATSGGDELRPIIKTFKHHFNRELKEANVPGGAFVIVKGNQIMAMNHFGVRKQGSSIKVNKDTVFRVASVSKTFAGELATMLIQQGVFKWDDPITKYIPDFKFKSAKHTENLTVKHILSHSTGVVHNAYDNLLEANYSLPRIIPHFKKISPNCDIGKCYGYQNVLFSLIQPIVEKTTGLSYEKVIHNKVFEPLEMSRSSVGHKAYLKAKNRATPHAKTRKGWVPVKVKNNYYQALPAAGVNTSIYDMSLWLRAQLGYKPDVISPRLLASVTRKQVRTRKDLRHRRWRKFLKDAYYGIGWRIYQFGDEDLIYHGGWVSGFRASIAYSKERDIGLAILMNAESPVITPLATSFWSKVLKLPMPEENLTPTKPKIMVHSEGP